MITTDIYRVGGAKISVGPVPGRKSVALALGRDGSPVVTTVAYFRSEEGAEDFVQYMKELLEDRYIEIGEDE